MKVVVFVPAEKRGDRGELVLTDKKIGEFEVSEPKYNELSKIGLSDKKRFIYETEVVDEKPVIKSMKIDEEAFVVFYGKVLDASGLSEDDIVKYGFNNADIALEQIYLAWTKDEKK